MLPTKDSGLTLCVSGGESSLGPSGDYANCDARARTMSGQIFKFLDPKNVDDVLVRGTIRISALAYFRKLEGVDWIADANEATTVVNAGGAVVTSESEEPQFETWGPAGFTKLFSAKTAGKMTFRGE